MRIVITGTTSGLGKACREKFATHDVEALDRPGHDLDRDLDAFVRSDFDVYINNAYSGFKQVELLYKLFEANRDRNCKIVSIGSVCADRTYDRVYPYAIHKRALADACLQLQQIDSLCKVTHLRLGRMDTPMVSHRIGPKMSPDVIADYIDRMIVMMPDSMLLKDITIDNHFTSSL